MTSIRSWLVMMQCSTDADVATTASRALELHVSLSASEPVPARPGEAARYIALVETLSSSAARPSPDAKAKDARARPSELLAGTSRRFWNHVLNELKTYVESDGATYPRKPL